MHDAQTFDRKNMIHTLCRTYKLDRPLLAAWSPSGSKLLIGSSDHLELFDVETSDHKQFDCQGNMAAWSSDGTMVASVDDAIRVWSSEGAALAVINSKRYYPTWGPGGYLATGGKTEFEIHHISPDGAARSYYLSAKSARGKATWSRQGRLAVYYEAAGLIVIYERIQ